MTLLNAMLLLHDLDLDTCVDCSRLTKTTQTNSTKRPTLGLFLKRLSSAQYTRRREGDQPTCHGDTCQLSHRRRPLLDLLKSQSNMRDFCFSKTNAQFSYRTCQQKYLVYKSIMCTFGINTSKVR